MNFNIEGLTSTNMFLWSCPLLSAFDKMQGEGMYLKVCQECQYGAVKDNKSHCNRESVYSYLTNCISKRALDYYLIKESSHALTGNSCVTGK